MTKPQRRLAGIVVAVVLFVVAMAALDMGPNWIIMPVALLGGVVAWVAIELLGSAPSISPDAELDEDESWQLFDPRIWSLRIALMSTSSDRHARLHRSLVDVIDDQLLATHGIDRHTEPDRARAVLGDDLADFVDADDPARLMRPLSRVERIVTRIERL